MRRGLAWWAAAALLLAGCGDSGAVGRTEAQPDRETLTVATGGQGGIYAVWGAAFAREITKRLDGYRGKPVETTGSVENLLRLRDGKAQIALTLGDTALDAVEGREAFDDPVAMKALAQIYPSYVQVVTRADAGVKTLAGLRGKRVSVGSPDSGTQVVAERVLDVAGIDPETDFQRKELGVADSARALQAGSIDAFFWSGGVPTGAVAELAKRTPVALVDLGRYARDLRTRWGDVYGRATVPAGTYGLDAGVRTVAIPNYVVVDEHMDNGLARDLTELLFDSGRVTDAARGAEVIAPIGLHPGAQDYYDHAG
jgi:uncharacterized protein